MNTSDLLPLAPDLWCLHGRVKLGLGIAFPARATVARLPSGELWMHSPVALDEASVRALEALGPVRHLVAPNLLHHLFLADAQARFPEATTWAPAGLAKKRPDLRIDAPLDVAETWGGAFEMLHIEGAAKASEHGFLHRASRTLILTDLVFNMEDGAPGVTGWLLRMAGTYGRLARSRVWSFMVDDRPAFERSLDALLDLDFDRLVMAHGHVIEAGAKPRLAAALGRSRPRASAPAPVEA